MILFLFIFLARVTSNHPYLLIPLLRHVICSALICKDSIKDFDEENWKLFKGKSSAPKFKSALAEARKKSKGSDSHSSDFFTTEPNTKITFTVKKKRGRPRKLKLLEARKRLQQLLFSNDVSCADEIKIILSRINSANELDSEEIISSKIGTLLKNVFCSEEFKIWQNNEDILQMVKHVAVKLINSK